MIPTNNIVRLKTGAFLDGLKNFVANLGTARDKAAGSEYELKLLTDGELLSVYRTSWLAQKIIDVPASDECRRWRNWQSSAENTVKMEEEENRLMLQQKVLQARIAARIFGGSVIYIGVGDQNPMAPLDPKTVKKGGLKALTIFPRSVLSRGDIDYDINSEGFGRPKWWELSVGSMSHIRVHPSRFVFFFGHRIPNNSSYEEFDWGDSVLTSVMQTIIQTDSAMANLASLIFEAKIDVLSIPDLMSNIDDPQYRKDLDTRLAVANMGKGNNGMFIMDAEETYNQKKMNFATLPEVMDRFFQYSAGAADIPMTRLFGMSPGGMNSTGDSDLINYYDRLQASQKLETGPALRLLDEVLIRSAIGHRPREIQYAWRSLWQSSEVEEAEMTEKLAKSMADIKATGLFSQEVLFKLAVAVFGERGAMKSLGSITAITPNAMKPEAVVVDPLAAANDPNAPPPKPGEAKPAVPAAPARPGLRAVGDSKVASLYVSRKVLNANEILSWAKEQGFTSALLPDDLHVTVVFSRESIDWMKLGQAYGADSKDGKITISAGGPRFVDRLGDAVALCFASSALSWRHEDAKFAGASTDFPDFQPHISISYKFEGDIALVKPYTGPIELGPEIFEEVGLGGNEHEEKDL